MLPPQTLIDQRYRIEGPLGAGGMGQVYRATDLSRGVVVALKVLPPEVCQDPDLRARFQREAELAARVDSGGGVARVHSYGRYGEREYCVLELVAGGDLEQAFQAGVSREDLLRIVAELARTLARCHAAGIVHRDVKPQNVLLTPALEPRLCDFGLAVDVSVEERLTLSQELLGTPAYMAPEQANHAREAGPPADVYSLGAILYRGLTGRPPFSGSPIAVLQQLLLEDPPPPSSLVKLPADLERVVEAALARDPEQRWTASQVAAALEALGRGERLDLKDVAGRRRRSLRVALVVLALSASGLAGAALLSVVRQARAREAVLAQVEEIEASALLDLEPLAPGEQESLRRAEAALAGSAERPERARLRSRLAARALWRAELAGEAPPLPPEASGLLGVAKCRVQGARAFGSGEPSALEQARRALRRAASRLEGGELAAGRAVGRELVGLEQRLALRRALEQDDPAKVSESLRVSPEDAEAFGLSPERSELAELKAAELEASAPAWRERLAKSPPREGLTLPREVAVMGALLQSAPAVRPPPALREALEGWFAPWVPWAEAVPPGPKRLARVRRVGELSTTLFDLDPTSWRDPPGLRKLLAAHARGLGPLSPGLLMAVLRVRGGDGTWPVAKNIGRAAPRDHLGPLRARYPESRALSYFDAYSGPPEALQTKLLRATRAARDDLDHDLQAEALLQLVRSDLPPLRKGPQTPARLRELLGYALEARALIRRDANLLRDSYVRERHLLGLLGELDDAKMRAILAAGIAHLQRVLEGLDEATRSFAQFHTVRIREQFARDQFGRGHYAFVAQVCEETIADPAFKRPPVDKRHLVYWIYHYLLESLLQLGREEEAIRWAKASPRRDLGKLAPYAAAVLNVQLRYGRFPDGRQDAERTLEAFASGSKDPSAPGACELARKLLEQE